MCRDLEAVRVQLQTGTCRATHPVVPPTLAPPQQARCPKSRIFRAGAAWERAAREWNSGKGAHASCLASSLPPSTASDRPCSLCNHTRNRRKVPVTRRFLIFSAETHA